MIPLLHFILTRPLPWWLAILIITTAEILFFCLIDWGDTDD